MILTEILQKTGHWKVECNLLNEKLQKVHLNSKVCPYINYLKGGGEKQSL